MTWQPIETAPKDGTVFLAYHKLWGPMDIRYSQTDTNVGLRMNWVNGDYTTAWPDHALTHWMPLPEPPEAK